MGDGMEVFHRTLPCLTGGGHEQNAFPLMPFRTQSQASTAPAVGLHCVMPDDQKTPLEPQDTPTEDWNVFGLDPVVEGPFTPDPAFLRKRLAVEAMHEAGQFIDPDDFDL